SACWPGSPTRSSETWTAAPWTGFNRPTTSAWPRRGSAPAPPAAARGGPAPPTTWEGPDEAPPAPARARAAPAGGIAAQPAPADGGRHGLRQRQPPRPTAGPDLEAPPGCQPNGPRPTPGATGRAAGPCP